VRLQALGWLLSEPGASGTILECRVPYCAEATIELLGRVRGLKWGNLRLPRPTISACRKNVAHPPSVPIRCALPCASSRQVPEQYCSSETAVALSRAALRRAAALSSFGAQIVGVGATCNLISGAAAPKRGDHRAWVAVSGAQGTRVVGVKMSKGARTRLGEDILSSQILVSEPPPFLPSFPIYLPSSTISSAMCSATIVAVGRATSGFSAYSLAHALSVATSLYLSLSIIHPLTLT
jgi:hypothetical protein